jgi:hypothetical protein
VRGVLLERCSWIAESGSSVDFAPRGSCSRAFGSRQFPDAFKENEIHGCKVQKEIITKQAQNSKALHLLLIFTHP